VPVEEPSTASTTEVAFSLDHLLGEHEKCGRIVRLSAVFWGVLPGSLRGGSGIKRVKSQKNMFRPKGWSKLVISFWCDGLDRERLDRQRTACVAAAIASG
jgi:hypothetical protein